MPSMNPYEASDQPPALRPQTSGLAIASLVTGLTCIFPAALICGHMALSRIKDSAGRLEGRGMAITGIVLGYAGIIPSILMILSILFVGARAWKKGSDRARCIINQRMIQQSVRAYQAHHFLSDYSSIDIEALKAETGLSSSAFICPAGGNLELPHSVPPVGILASPCPHAADLQHAPTDHSNW